MNIQQDFEELLKLLEDNSVRYLIVGGYAVAFHGFPRLTKDIDFYFDGSIENVKNIINSLVEFGFPEKDLNFDMFTSEGNIITFGVEPVRVDFLNQISGVDFKEAWDNKIRGKYGNVEVNFIGRTQLNVIYVFKRFSCSPSAHAPRDSTFQLCKSLLWACGTLHLVFLQKSIIE